MRGLINYILNKFNNQYFLFIASIIFISILFFINATSKIYLFDSTIVYYYGYLLNIGYEPFTDFTTPLLPFIGLIQKFLYNALGYNYISGVIGAYIVSISQFIIINHYLKKITGEIFSSLFYSILITLGCLPIYGTLYYNHFLISQISIFFILKYYFLRIDNKLSLLDKLFHVICYLLVGIVLLTKIHWGIFLLSLNIILDYIYLAKRNRSYLKLNMIGITFLFCFVFIILKICNANLSYFISNINGISILENINFSGILRFINIPTGIFSNIEITPLFFLLVFLFYSIYQNKKLSFIFNPNTILFLSLIIFCFFIIINSVEAFSILISLEIILLFYFEQLTKEHSSSVNSKNIIFKTFKYAISTYFLIFIIFYIVFSNRKLWNEKEGTFQSIQPTNFFKDSNYYSNENAKEITKFFWGIKLKNYQINEFSKLDSLIKEYNFKKIFFGPELEIFNVVYKIKPLKEFPLWVHPGLSINKKQIALLENKFISQDPDMIVLMKNRIYFMPFILRIIEKDYIQISNNESWILVYKKKLAPIKY